VEVEALDHMGFGDCGSTAALFRGATSEPTESPANASTSYPWEHRNCHDGVDFVGGAAMLEEGELLLLLFQEF
jgi:hypothetical protein